MTLRTRLAGWPIRRKLLALALLPLGVALPLLAALMAGWTTVAFDRLLSTKVRADLAVAHGYFDKVLGDVGSSATSVAESRALYDALTHDDQPALAALLTRLQQRESLDFVRLVRLPAAAAEATVDGHHGAHLEVLSPDALRAMAPALATREPVPLLPTRNAAPTERRVEDRALVILARAPVHAPDGHVIAQVQAGLLLNRNLAFIDRLNEIVYPAGSLPYGSVGTATLFLDDVRISTNVRLFGPDGEARAIGTRVSQAVRDSVLGQGHAWFDRAFVVDDWYVSGYEPVVDSAGRRVGMLYVGFLERPFTWLKAGVLGAMALVFAALMALGALASLRWARRLSAPLERMSQTMDAAQAGDLRARVGPLASHDEIGQLGTHLDRLLDVIEDNTAALQRWGEELDRKVAERTQALEQAQQHLVRSEKLAAIGQLTASISHEINNPIAVIQGNLDLVRELLGPQARPVRGELDLIDQQVERMRLIVTQLLQFARPSEYAGYVDHVDTARLLTDCLVLVKHLLAHTHITVRTELQATHQPVLNRGELQQVLVNLLVNAIHAMPAGGELTLESRDRPEGGLEIRIADTGVGLAPDLLEELFQPFVTRKKDGTGLGLWISRNIVERYAGTLHGQGRDDGRPGAVFVVRL